MVLAESPNPSPTLILSPMVGTPELTALSEPPTVGDPNGAVPVDPTLSTVGLLPRATGSGSDLEAFYIKVNFVFEIDAHEGTRGGRKHFQLFTGGGGHSSKIFFQVGLR